MSTPILITKEYIGDAVYVDFDGYYLILTTEDGISVTNTIYLEPSVLKALDRYRARLQEAIEQHNRKTGHEGAS